MDINSVSELREELIKRFFEEYIFPHLKTKKEFEENNLYNGVLSKDNCFFRIGKDIFFVKYDNNDNRFSDPEKAKRSSKVHYFEIDKNSCPKEHKGNLTLIKFKKGYQLFFDFSKECKYQRILEFFNFFLYSKGKVDEGVIKEYCDDNDDIKNFFYFLSNSLKEMDMFFNVEDYISFFEKKLIKEIAADFFNIVGNTIYVDKTKSDWLKIMNTFFSIITMTASLITSVGIIMTLIKKTPINNVMEMINIADDKETPKKEKNK